jgi:CrcB protein
VGDVHREPGGFVLGIVVVAWADGRRGNLLVRPFVAVGFCGGLTTFSTWMVESVLLTRDGDGGTALLYLAASLLTGVAVVVLGMGVARRVAHRPLPVFDPELDD